MISWVRMIADKKIKNNILVILLKNSQKVHQVKIRSRKKLLCNPSVKFSVILLTIELD